MAILGFFATLSCILQLTDTCLFGQHVKTIERVPCVCTAVVFCSTTCRAKAVVHKCPGAPAERVDLDEMMRREREKGPGSVSGMARNERDAWTQELEPCTQTPTPYTLHPAPYTLHSTPETRNLS